MKPSHAAICLVAVSLTAACGDSPSEPAPQPQPNDAPVITSVTPANIRVEMGEGVQVTAVVTDNETPVSQLTFQWGSSGGGSFDGSGTTVTWRPTEELFTPARVDITLQVIERYTVRVAGGTEVRENRSQIVSASVQVNHSRRELADLTTTFLNDFANADDTRQSAEYCVRNFTDACRGKASELEDIMNIRALYTTVDTEISVERIEFNADRTVAYVFAPCGFRDIERESGELQDWNRGICALTARYEPYRWWLCTSNWCESYDRCNPQPNSNTSLAEALRLRR